MNFHTIAHPRNNSLAMHKPLAHGGDMTNETVIENAEYKAAYAAMTEAHRKYAKVSAAYRARTIGDAEFLSARRERDAEAVKFDAAFAKAANW